MEAVKVKKKQPSCNKQIGGLTDNSVGRVWGLKPTKTPGHLEVLCL